MKKFETLKKTLVVAVLAASLSACGQGPHLVGPAENKLSGPQGDGGRIPAPGGDEPSVEPSGEPSGTPSGTPSAGPSGEPGPKPSGSPSSVPSGAPGSGPSSNPSSMPTTQPTTAPSTSPSAAPSTAPSAAPAQGSVGVGGGTTVINNNTNNTSNTTNITNGQNGANGRDGKDGCGDRLFQASFPARHLKDAELKMAELPYRSTSANMISISHIGESNHLTKNGIPYSRDQQLAFGVDVTLPFKASVVKVKELSMRMKLGKLPTETQNGKVIYLDTELFCLLDAKRCSGKVYTDRAFLPNINPLFFDGKGQVSSDAFTKIVLEHSNAIPGTAQRYYWSESARLDLVSAFPDLNVAEMIYSEAKPNEDPHFVDKVVRFVIADDTYVSEARLDVKMIVNTCADPAPQRM